jgi:hypothetical protein
MGFLDKLKGAMNMVTGNAAKVTIEFTPAVAIPGDRVNVRITAVSTGQEVKSQGVFLDMRGNETISLPKGVARDEAFTHEKETIKNEHQIAPPFVLGANETKTFEGQVVLPPAIQPTYEGVFTKHLFEIRGRVEAKGNDPDSGWKQIRVGTRN